MQRKTAVVIFRLVIVIPLDAAFATNSIMSEARQAAVWTAAACVTQAVRPLGPTVRLSGAATSSSPLSRNGIPTAMDSAIWPSSMP